MEKIKEFNMVFFKFYLVIEKIIKLNSYLLLYLYIMQKISIIKIYFLNSIIATIYIFFIKKL